MDKVVHFRKNKYLRNFILLFSGTSLSSIFSFLSTPLLLKAVGLEKNGIIFLGLSYVGFFNTLFAFQSFDSIIKFLPNNMSFNNKKGINYIKQAIILDISTACVSFFIGFLLLDSLSNYFNWNYEVVEVIKIFLWTTFFSMNGCFSGVLRIFEKFNYMSLISVYSSLFNFVLVFIGTMMKLGFNYFITIVIVNSILTFLGTLFLTIKTLRINGMRNLNLLNVKFDKEFLKFSFFTNLSSTLDLPIFQLTPFIINRYIGISDVAIYKILEKLGEIIKKVTSPISQTVIPEISKKIAQNNEESAHKLGIKVGKMIFIIGVLGVIFISFTKKYWLDYFVPNYQNHLYAIYLYFILVIFTQMFSLQHPIFIYSGFVKENIYILIFVNIIYIFFMVFMTKYYGLVGLITSRIIQASIIFISKGVILKKHKKMKSTKKM